MSFAETWVVPPSSIPPDPLLVRLAHMFLMLSAQGTSSLLRRNQHWTQIVFLTSAAFVTGEPLGVCCLVPKLIVLANRTQVGGAS